MFIKGLGNSFVKNEKTFILCNGCTTESRIYLPDTAVIFRCPICRKTYSEKSISTKTKITPLSFTIPLYTRGEIEKESYTVIGCASKRDKRSPFAIWEEYVLTTDQGKVAFLNQSNGHWMLLKERDKPSGYQNRGTNSFQNDDNLIYEHFISYHHVTRYFLGEFPYNLVNVKNILIKEYISPPFIFSAESGDKTFRYYQGKYIRPYEIKKSFSGESIQLPSREGIGSCQPFYFGIKSKRFVWLSVLFFAITWPLYQSLRSSPSNLPIVSVGLTSDDTNPFQKTVSPSFELSGSSSLLRIDSYCPIRNNWAEAQTSLVNETTGEERSFNHGIEYYEGYDSEGAWSEGSKYGTIYLNKVSPGKYHIESKLFTSASKGTVFRFDLYKDYPTRWNYWFMIFTLAGICLIVTLANNYFETKRNE